MATRSPGRVTHCRHRFNASIAPLAITSFSGDSMPGDHGAASSLVRWLRSPSVTFSAHMKTQVKTLCGQA